MLFVIIAVATLAVTGTKGISSDATGESARAEALMKANQFGTSESSPPQYEFAYVHSDNLTVDDPAYRTTLTTVEASMSKALGGEVTVSTTTNGHSALVSSPLGRPFSTEALQASVKAAGGEQVNAVLDDDGSANANNDLNRAERLSVPVTLLVLLIAFGTLVAALVPVLLGLTAVLATFGLIGPISQLLPVSDAVKTVVLLIGMAVGVDYALFYVIRSREERASGLTSRQALEHTAGTSGRTVVVAGTTVAIAMAGLFMVGSDVLNAVAAGTIAVVVCAVVASVTVLPGVLQLLGDRVDRGRIPFLPHLGSGTESRFWPPATDRVLRRPKLCLVGAVLVLAGLAVPAFGLHVSYPNSTAINPPVLTSLQSQITRDFPWTSSPAIVVFTWPAGERQTAMDAASTLETLATATGVASPQFSSTIAPNGRAAVVELPLRGLGDDTASKQALAELRSDLIPETLGRIHGAHVAVTGEAARDVDYTTQMTNGLPYLISFVLGLAFFMLLVTFRSLIIPIKAALLNILSVGASYGVLVLVFQHHWADGILGFRSTGSIIAWLPLFLFVVLFGLSMDYHIFILRRIRENVDGGLPTDLAIRHGVARTAGVVTSAALVMFGVFSLFGTAQDMALKQAGVGLAVAVLLDATVVRAVLLPASMKLLGDRNWYLPSWLRWLQRASTKSPGPSTTTSGSLEPAAVEDWISRTTSSSVQR
jgi:RND superfamily putative drug exporter